MELEGADLRIAAARTNAGIAQDVPLPPDSWRRRSTRHLEAFRAFQTRAAKLEADNAEHARDLADLSEKLASTPVVDDLTDLRAALAEMPADGEARLRKAQAASSKAMAHAETGRVALSWGGSALALAQATLPSMGEVAAVVTLAQRARDERRQSLKDAETAERDIAEQHRRLRQISTGDALPTPDAVRAARKEREASLGDVRSRLSAPRRDDDALAGERLSEHISRVDALVDRRDADAKRVAEHTFASAALEEAQARYAIAEASARRWLEALQDTELKWASTLDGVGLPERLSPVGFEAWRADRDRVVRDFAAAADAQTVLEDLQGDLEVKHDRLGLALAGVGSPFPDNYIARLREGQAVLSRHEQAALARAGLFARREALDRQSAALNREREAITETGERLSVAENVLCQEGGVRVTSGALEQAVEELDATAADVVSRVGLVRQVQSIRNDLRVFSEDVGTLLVSFGREPTLPTTDIVRSLAHELKAALKSQEAVSRSRNSVERATAAARSAQRRIDMAQVQIDELLAVAQVTTEAEVDPVIAAAGVADSARARQEEALRELADAGDGPGHRRPRGRECAAPGGRGGGGEGRAGVASSRD